MLLGLSSFWLAASRRAGQCHSPWPLWLANQNVSYRGMMWCGTSEWNWLRFIRLDFFWTPCALPVFLSVPAIWMLIFFVFQDTHSGFFDPYNFCSSLKERVGFSSANCHSLPVFASRLFLASVLTWCYHLAVDGRKLKLRFMRFHFRVDVACRVSAAGQLWGSCWLTGPPPSHSLNVANVQKKKKECLHCEPLIGH